MVEFCRGKELYPFSRIVGAKVVEISFKFLIGSLYHCLANSLCTMVSKMLQCTTIEGLLGGVKEWDMLGASTWKPWINWSTRVGNLCVMFKVIHSSCQLSVT